MKSSLVTSKVSVPYAEALMSVAQANNLTEQFGENLRTLLSLFKTSPDFQDFISNPITKAEAKKAVIAQILGSEFNPLMLNFLQLLIDKRRVLFIEAIANEYLALLRKLNQTVLAEVTTAISLTPAQTELVIQKIRSITNANQVEIENKIDTDIIGGVIIKIGSQIIDSSLRTQLRRIGMNLAA